MERILVVSENGPIRNLLLEVFKNDFFVNSIDKVSGAFIHCKTQDYDALIIDNTTKSGANRVDVVPEIRAIQPDLKIFLLSGGKISTEIANESGVDVLIRKPLPNAEELKSLVRECIGKKELPPKLVMVVDDHAGMRSSVSSIVKKLGCVVIEANNGREARSLLFQEREKEVDLIIIDNQLTEFNRSDLGRPFWGIQTIQYLRDRKWPGSIILMSSEEIPDEEHLADAFLLKDKIPYRIPELLNDLLKKS